MGNNTKIAAAVLHKGEEPSISGKNGSGTVFFSGCTLGCPFCQNDQISNGKIGSSVSDVELSNIFLKLQTEGATNINLVTASQFTPSVVTAVNIAKKRGLDIPIVWNSSGYEKTSSIETLAETVNIWLPDLKTLDKRLAQKLFKAPEYPSFAEKAIIKMVELVKQNGGTQIENKTMRKGIILRHLVIPGELESTKAVLKWYSKNLKKQAMLSLMVQYTPVNKAGKKIAPKGYIIPQEEYNELMGMLYKYEIEEGFIQEPEAASEEWIPNFLNENPFPPNYSKPVWHWENAKKQDLN